MPQVLGLHAKHGLLDILLSLARQLQLAGWFGGLGARVSVERSILQEVRLFLTLTKSSNDAALIFIGDYFALRAILGFTRHAKAGWACTEELPADGFHGTLLRAFEVLNEHGLDLSLMLIYVDSVF